jgi:hypothetical protein
MIDDQNECIGDNGNGTGGNQTIGVLDCIYGERRVPLKPPPPLTAINDRFAISLDDVRGWLELPASYDDASPENKRLVMMATVAKQIADSFCNNPFVDDQDAPLPIPEGVQFAVMNLIADLYWEHKARAKKQQQAGGAVTQRRAGELSESYAAAEKTELSATVQNALLPYRLMPRSREVKRITRLPLTSMSVIPENGM